MLFNNNLKESSKKHIVSKLQNKIDSNDIVMLTTIDLRGKPKSRPLRLLNGYKSESLCFFSNEFFGKINEIVQNPLVCLSYSNPPTKTYLSMIGQAYINNDPQQMQELWQPILKEWFPACLKTPNLALLIINIEEIQEWGIMA